MKSVNKNMKNESKKETNKHQKVNKQENTKESIRQESKFKKFLGREITETKLLFKALPSWVLLMFTLSVVLMNLFANKSINTNLTWLALDCGIILSWASFLSMDIIVKRFGAKASTKVSVFVLLVNLLITFTFFIVAKIAGEWGESFIDFGGDIANTALNNTLSGSWFVVLGSSVAFLVSAIVNSVLNALIGKMIKTKNFAEFSVRTYISTFIGQFVDNLIFAFIVSLNFFGWSALQCFTCALTGAVVELLCEVVFSPLGYKVCKHWESQGVGSEYLAFIQNKAQ